MVRSTLETMSFPSRTKRSSGRDSHEDVDVARARRRAPPAWPSPREADALAVVDARRNLDLERALLGHHARRPSQSAHGVGTTWPAPPQSGQVCVRTNWPKTEAGDRLEPPRAAAAATGLGARAREPRRSRGRSSQAAATGNGHGAHDARARPRRARSRPRRGRRRHGSPAGAPPRAPKMSSPKKAEKRSARLAKSKSVGRKPPVAQALVAVAVVELARLGLREHLVGLGRLAEPLLGVRARSETSGMQLAREACGTPS